VILIGSLLVSILGSQGFRVPLIIGLLGLALLFSLDKGFNRVTVYAIFIPLFFIFGFSLNILTPAIVILVGGVLMGLGIYLFVNFLNKYPLQPDDEEGLS
jgi:Ca2+/Na+ antiporter